MPFPETPGDPFDFDVSQLDGPSVATRRDFDCQWSGLFREFGTVIKTREIEFLFEQPLTGIRSVGLVCMMRETTLPGATKADRVDTLSADIIFERNNESISLGTGKPLPEPGDIQDFRHTLDQMFTVARPDLDDPHEETWMRELFDQAVDLSTRPGGKPRKADVLHLLTTSPYEVPQTHVSVLNDTIQGGGLMVGTWWHDVPLDEDDESAKRVIQLTLTGDPKGEYDYAKYSDQTETLRVTVLDQSGKDKNAQLLRDDDPDAVLLLAQGYRFSPSGRLLFDSTTHDSDLDRGVYSPTEGTMTSMAHAIRSAAERLRQTS